MKVLKTIGKILFGLVIVLAVIFGAGYLLTFGDYQVPQTVAQDSSLPHITIDGATYHAETFGDPANPVVIAIHGGPGGDYRSILSLQALADEYYVVFYDQRGTGLSPRVDSENLTLEGSIADLNSIVDAYSNGGKVNLVGHSWGAMLASAYLGKYPDKVDHAVLAEPGFLTSEFAAKWAEQVQLKFSPGVLYHLLKTKFEALHVKGPDDQAADDYFSHQINLYQGSDHPQIGYYCSGDFPIEETSWRNGALAAGTIQQGAMDADGNFDVNLVAGIENFNHKVLFMSGECQQVIGPDWQREQMKLFPNAELVVISDSGHEMFFENPEASIAAVRDYLGEPLSE
jgi:proline iminopeptidase